MIRIKKIISNLIHQITRINSFVMGSYWKTYRSCALFEIYFRKQGSYAKLIPQITNEINERLKVCCYAKLAVTALGVPEGNYYYWL